MRMDLATCRLQQIALGCACLGLFFLAMWWARMPELWLSLLPPCLFHQLSGWPCPSCGATRATLAFASGDWLSALQYNPLVTAIYLAAMIGAVMIIVSAIFAKRLHSNQIDAAVAKARGWIIGGLLANWVYLIAQKMMR